MIQFAILGCGNIANRVANGILHAKEASLYAVASRSEERALQYKEKYGAKVYYTDYEKLCQDENVDVIYICTPNQWHYSQIEMCLSHHKNVVCEKPMVKNQTQVKALFQKAKEVNCFLMEAHKTCFTPLNQLIKKRLDANEFGKIISIQADYSFDVRGFYGPDSWAMDPEFGGCSFDIGVYPTCFAHFMANSKVKEMTGYPILQDGIQADFGMMTQIQYENGILAQLNSSWLHTTPDKGKALLVCEKGTIEIPAFWKGNRAIIHKGMEEEIVTVNMESDFTGEVEEVARCIENEWLESPTMGCDSSCEIIKVIKKVNEYRM